MSLTPSGAWTCILCPLLSLQLRFLGQASHWTSHCFSLGKVVSKQLTLRANNPRVRRVVAICLLTAFQVPGSMLSTCLPFSGPVPRALLRGKWQWPHFIDEETETQRRAGSYGSSQCSEEVAELREENPWVCLNEKLSSVHCPSFLLSRAD